MTRNPLSAARLTAVLLWFLLASIFHFVRILPFGKRSSNDATYVKLLAPVARTILGLHYTIRPYKEPLPLPCVFIMNHQSALDLFSNAEIYPDTCIVIVKRALTKVPFFGWIAALGDNIFLDRENRSRSMEQMAEARNKITQNGLSVWIFPEGTRRNSGSIHNFKRGAFHLAIQAQVPIVPVVASSYRHHVDIGRWKSGRIIIEVLDPVPTKGLQADDVDSLIARCHSAMQTAFRRITAELEPTNSRT